MANLILGDKEYSNIKNLIFDLGGVILNIDFQKAINNLKEIGFVTFDKLYNQLDQSSLFDNFDKGLITPSEFREELCKATNIIVSDEAFNKAWNSMLVEIPVDIIRLLKNLKKYFKTFLLSNTNEIHLEHLFNYTQRTYNLKSLDPLFDKPYFSCRVHMRKPDNEIYVKVLNDENLISAETLFIDDFQFNVDAAVKLGIQGYCLQKDDSLKDIFKKYINQDKSFS